MKISSAVALVSGTYCCAYVLIRIRFWYVSMKARQARALRRAEIDNAFCVHDTLSQKKWQRLLPELRRASSELCSSAAALFVARDWTVIAQQPERWVRTLGELCAQSAEPRIQNALIEQCLYLFKIVAEQHVKELPDYAPFDFMHLLAESDEAAF